MSSRRQEETTGGLPNIGQEQINIVNFVDLINERFQFLKEFSSIVVN